MSEKKILITVFHSFISKNILDTEVFEIIKTDPGLEIVLLVPMIKKDFFEKEYGSSNIIIEGVDTRLFAVDSKVKLFSRLAFFSIDSHYLRYKKKQRLQDNKTTRGYLKYIGESLFTLLFAGRIWPRKLLRFAFQNYISIPAAVAIFEKHKPDVIFSTDAFDETDILFAREARVQKVKVISMVRSWDNCYSKGVLRVLPDHLIVNTEELKKEASTMHDVPVEKIYVGGLPQFDASLTEQRTSREHFFRNIDGDSKKKLIFFGPAGHILSDTDWQVAEIIRRAIADKKLPPSQVFVSNHPNHPADFSKFKNDGSFIFTCLGKKFSLNPKETEFTVKDTKFLRDLLFHSEVIIYVASTIGIDSLQYDKPQIIIDFDGWEKKPYINSVKKYHHEDHMKKMLDLGGVTIARNPDQLIEAIKNYFQNPDVHHIERQLMIKQQLFRLDGQSGKRIGQHIISLIHSLS